MPAFERTKQVKNSFDSAVVGAEGQLNHSPATAHSNHSTGAVQGFGTKVVPSA